nr:hypothetical protein CFP56_30651 [Quercus suber]
MGPSTTTKERTLRKAASRQAHINVQSTIHRNRILILSVHGTLFLEGSEYGHEASKDMLKGNIRRSKPQQLIRQGEGQSSSGTPRSSPSARHKTDRVARQPLFQNTALRQNCPTWPTQCFEILSLLLVRILNRADFS